MLFLPVVLLSWQFTGGLLVPNLYLNPAHVGSLPQLNAQSISERTLWLAMISSHAKAGTIK
jgi:hypothetical protein